MKTQSLRSEIETALSSHELMASAGIKASELPALIDLRNAVSKLVVPGNRLAAPDFLDLNDEVILDRSTGLHWHKKISAKGLDEAGEKSYIADLNARAVGGFADWACPTRRQLVTLINDETHAPATFSQFKDSTKTDYWYRTSTALSADSGNRWFVDFYLGGVDNLHRLDDGFVRAVRVASPGQ